MSDSKPTTNNPKMLGGINLKSSEYSLSKAEFLNLRNVDFDIPNALSKRPGSTQAIGANTSGPILAINEFVSLNGNSTVIVASNQALFYMNGASLNLLDLGWSNSQPPDMLTFVNKEWIANGSKFYGWSGLGSTPMPAGLPIQTDKLTPPAQSGSTAAAFSVFGFTMGTYSGLTTGARVYLYGSYAYSRADGYQGPLNSITTAAVVSPFAIGINPDGGTFWQGATNGNYGVDTPLILNGITSPPSGYGITALALYFLIDTGVGLSMANSDVSPKNSLGGAPFPNYIGLKSSIDQSNFKFFTLIPFSSPTLTIIGASFWPGGGAVPSGGFLAPASRFSLMTFGWFNSNTPKYLELNQNVMFMAGFSNAPSNVWFSDLGAPESIQPENVFEVRTNDGDRVYAIKAYNNQLIALKQTSFHKVIGDSPENFELIDLSGEYGCISNQTVIEYQEKLLWLDQKGVIQFNGTSWEIISTAVEDIFRRMNLDAAKEYACAVHHLYRNQVWFGIPIDGSTQNNITVVYDYLVNAWTFFDGFNPSSFGFVKASANKPTVWRGNYSGMVYYHGESFLGDNGQGISCVLTPHWDKNKENETWIWRRTFLDVATVTGLTGVITGRVFSNYDINTVQATFSFFQNAFQSRGEMGVVGKAVTAEFAHFSASLPLLVNNYSWAKRFLRNV